MNVNKQHLRKQLQKRKEEKLYDNKPIGSAIRFKRKSMNMTLEEASEGICSVSYLSKLENNLIEPGEKFVDQLVKKFKLDEAVDYDLTQYDQDKKKLFSDMFFNKIPEITMLDLYKDRDDHQAFLIQMFVYLLNENYPEAIKSYNNLKYYITNLTDDELSAFFIGSSKLLSHEDKYSDAYEMLEFEPVNNENNHYLQLIYTREKLKLAMRMHKTPLIIELYASYSHTLIDYEYYDALKEIKALYIFETASEHTPNQIHRMAKNFRTLSQDQKDIAVAKSYYYHGDFEMVIKMIKDKYKTDSKWLMYYLMAADKLHRFDLIKSILDIESELHTLSYGSNLILLHFRHKYVYDKDTLLNYLRKDILGYGHLTDDYLLLDFLMMDAQSLFAKHQFYKEAVSVISHLLPKLKTLKQAIS